MPAKKNYTAVFFTARPMRFLGAFPIDMLRYDFCHPRDQESVSVILDTINGREVEAGQEVRLVHRCIKGASLFTPTAARWESFGWQVGNVMYQ